MHRNLCALFRIFLAAKVEAFTEDAIVALQARLRIYYSLWRGCCYLTSVLGLTFVKCIIPLTNFTVLIINNLNAYTTPYIWLANVYIIDSQRLKPLHYR